MHQILVVFVNDVTFILFFSTCEDGGNTYYVGQSFQHSDGCNTCWCTDRGAVCSKIWCGDL